MYVSPPATYPHAESQKKTQAWSAQLNADLAAQYKGKGMAI